MRNIPIQPIIPIISISNIISIKADTDAIINSIPIIPLYFRSKVREMPSINNPTTNKIPPICNAVVDAIIAAPTSLPNSLASPIADKFASS